MDAFYVAKRIRDQLPPLPEGIVPSYIHTLDTVKELSSGDHLVRVSDVAKEQQLPRPVVTRTVKEMEALGLLSKTADEKDRRVVLLALTAQGEALYQRYVNEYFTALVQRMPAITNEETEEMIRTIGRIRAALEKRQ